MPKIHLNTVQQPPAIHSKSVKLCFIGGLISFFAVGAKEKIDALSLPPMASSLIHVLKHLSICMSYTAAYLTVSYWVQWNWSLMLIQDNPASGLHWHFLFYLAECGWRYCGFELSPDQRFETKDPIFLAINALKTSAHVAVFFPRLQYNWWCMDGLAK